MALRLKPETRERWKRFLDGQDNQYDVWRQASDTSWRPVPRAEPAPEIEMPAPDPMPGPFVHPLKRNVGPGTSLSRFDIYHDAWVD